MRHNGRKNDELRPITVERSFLTHAEGSVFIKMGSTWVLCAVSVEEQVPPFLAETGQGWITAEYSMLPRSTAERMPRESMRGKVKGRTHEIQRLIGRSLRAVVDLERLGARTLRVDCDVIQADGGTRTTSITGAFQALKEAVESLMHSGLITENPIKDDLAAVSCGIVKGQPLLDLDYKEDSQASVDANFVITGRGQLVEVQATGEEGPFGWDEFEELGRLAQKGVKEILEKVASS